MPTEAIKMTTGTALSLIPMRPIMPKSSTVIKAKTVTFKKNTQDEWLGTNTLWVLQKFFPNYSMSVIYKELYRYVLIDGYKFNIV